MTILSITADSTISQRGKHIAQKKSAWQQNLHYPFQEHQELAGNTMQDIVLVEREDCNSR